MSAPKEYFAFISYQRKDERIADELRHKLEHYHLPSNVRKENPSFPKTIYPIFRDTLELSGGVLSEQIEQALDQSKYLIVVCSPNSAKSPWVNKEIQTFIKMGKERKIIPFIINGEPNSKNPDLECFPPALRELTGSKELLGININELGREAAAIKVVACMFGLKFDSLWQRFQREQRRKRWMMIGGAVLFALISLSIGLYITRKNVELDAANWQMKINQSRAVAEKINNDVDKLGVLRAMDILLEVSPDSEYNPNWPYTYDVENCLRKLYYRRYKGLPYISDVLTGHEESATVLCYSPDGKFLISGGYDMSIRKWNLETGQLDIKPISDYGEITSLCYSPDGKYIASGRFNGTIQIWDAKNGSLIGENGPSDGEAISSICYSPNGNLIAFGQMVNFGIYDDYIRPIYIWDIRNERNTCILGHKGTINSISFSPDGCFIASSSDKETYIRIWDINSKKQIGSLFGHEKPITSICYSLDGKSLISASEDKTIRVWNLETQMQIGESLIGHEAAITSVHYSIDRNYIISASEDGTIRIWDIHTNKCINVLKVDKIAHYPLCLNLQKKEAAIALDGGAINIWNLEECLNCKTIAVSEEGFEAVCYSPNGENIAFGADDNAIHIWNIETSQKLNFSLVGHDAPISSICYSPNGEYIVSASYDGTLRIWNADNGKQLALSKHKGIVTSICYSPDGEYIIFESNDLIWKMNITKELKELHECIIEPKITFVNTTSISPNGKHIIYGGGYSNAEKDIENAYAYLFDGLIHKPLKGHRLDVTTVCFSPDGKQAVSGSADNSIRIWDTETGNPIGTLLAGNTSVNSVCFSPDGKYLISGMDDGTIQLWDMQVKKSLGSLIKGHEGVVESVCFSPDGKSIMSASSGYKYVGFEKQKTPAEIKIWKFIPTIEIISKMNKQLKKRELTSEELQRFYLK